MKEKWQLIVGYWYCSHKNYDTGSWNERVISEFSSKEKADEYLEKHRESLSKEWGDTKNFEVRKAPDIPFDPK